MSDADETGDFERDAATARIMLRVGASEAFDAGHSTFDANAEAVLALLRDRAMLRRALATIADCPNPNSVEDCHNRMSDVAKAALEVSRSGREP